MGLIVDLFAGGGGASTGIEAALGRCVDVAVNHDAAAVEMHAANHPGTLHLCEDVFDVDPLEACGGRPVDVLWASPDCKHFSRAKGGKPVDKRIRGLANVVVTWAARVCPKVILLENVPEFLTWGPLGADDRPIKERAGEDFARWKGELEALGYRVEHRMLVAADYGAPTIRKRLYLVARRDGLPIVWPEASHGRVRSGDLFDGGVRPWRTAAECIDWSIPCPSIFGRKRPLAEKTLQRIARGLKRYVLEAREPFIVSLTHHGGDRAEGLGEPMRTVTGAHRGEKALVMPYLTEHANASSPRCFAADEPLRTQVAQVKGGHFAVVAPTLIQTGFGEREGQAPRAPGLDKPLGTIVAGGAKHALVSAFLAKHFGGVVGQDARVPASTVTAVDHHGLVAAHLTKLYGTSTGADVREPMPTVTGEGQHVGEVRAFLVKYYGNEREGCSIEEPMHTVTSKDRLGLVTIHGVDYAIVDIGMRMLSPRELARAQGFPEEYVLTGTKTNQVARIGNSVCPPVAEALVRANCGFASVVEQEVAV